MTPIQRSIHDQAVQIAAGYRRSEWRLIEILQKVERQKIYREVGRASLFQYAVEFLKLTEPLAYAFSAVTKKSLEFSALSHALQDGLFSVVKIVRITAVMNAENVEELIVLASTCTHRELDEKRAELDPKKKKRTSKKPVRQGFVRYSTDLSKKSVSMIERVMTLRSKKRGVDEDEIIQEVFGEYLERHDPVLKAERLVRKPLPKKKAKAACARKATIRKPLPAAVKHAVNNRDKGRCVFVNESNVRCAETKWVHLHHVIEVSKGGTNHPSNLRTLCAFHHDLVHQLSFPIEAQFNWIDPQAPK